jgi:hypothetical protein
LQIAVTNLLGVNIFQIILVSQQFEISRMKAVCRNQSFIPGIFFGCLSLLLQRSLSEVVRYEAEDGSLTHAKVRNSEGGYSGDGYVDFNGQGAVLEWTYDAPVGGDYFLLVRYSAANTRPADLFMDGRPNPEGAFDFSSTGSWSTWQTETMVLPLSRESHTFRIVASDSTGPNIDWMEVTSPGGVSGSNVEAVVLEPNTYLEMGKFVLSPSGNYQVGLTSTGNLELQDSSSSTLWSAGSSGENRCFMQGDGNMVVRDASNKVQFATHTSANNGASFVISDAGVVAIVLSGVTLWKTGPSPSPGNNPAPAPTLAPPPQPTSFDNEEVVLDSGNFFERNSFVSSPSGAYRAGLTNSGDFVLQDGGFNTIWSAGISGGHRCFMQTDGNLIVRDSSNSALWDSRTSNNHGARLIVDDGGRIAVEHGSTPLWMSGLPRGLYQRPAASEDLQFPVRGAFYYPWYPETWSVNGHLARFEPDLGFYNSGDPTVAQAHIDALEYAYVDLSITSWWGPNTNLDRARITLLMDETIAMESSIKWTVYHEDERQEDQSPERIKVDLDYLKKWFAWHPAWGHIDRRPVIFVYNEAGCEVADRWMQASGSEWYVVLKLFKGFRDCQTQPDR